MVNYSGGRKSLTLPVAKREIHNGHDLWAELLRLLLSGPRVGMHSRNADAGGLQDHSCPLEGTRKGWGAVWPVPASVREARGTPVGDSREGDCPGRLAELGLG